MKCIRLFSVRLLIMFAGSFQLACVYEHLAPDVPTWGSASALVNKEKWGSRYPGFFQTIRAIKGTYGTAIPCQNEYYYIRADIFNNSAFLRESIHFIKVPFTKGKHKIIDFDFQCVDNEPVAYGSFWTSSSDGDVSQDNYDVLETADNYIVIDFYNTNTMEVKGSFQVTLVINRRSLNDPSTLPDTLRFTNGLFHTKIL